MRVTRGRTFRLLLGALSNAAVAAAFLGTVFVCTSEAQFNQAMRKDTRRWIQHKDNASLVQQIFTVECWIKASTRVEIVSRDEIWSRNGDWSIVYDYPRQRLEFMTQINGGLDIFFWTPDNSLVAGEWNHVACVVNGEKGTLRMYIGGELKREATFSTRTFACTTGIAWGGYYNNSPAFDGKADIDEGRYWSLERSPEELQRAKNSRLAYDDRFGLVGYWMFCGNFADSSGMGNHGDPVGNPAIVDAPDLPMLLACDREPLYLDKPRLSADPLDFGSIECDEEAWRDSVLVIRNTGIADLILRGASITGPQFSSFRLISPARIPPEITIPPNGIFAFTIRFTPSTRGWHSAQLVLQTNDSAQLIREIRLTGRREDLSLSLVPSLFDFGDVTPDQLPIYRSVRIQNTGTLPVTLSQSFFSPGTGFILRAQLPDTLAPGDTTTLEALFVGPSHGSYRSLLRLLRTPCDTLLNIPVRGVVSDEIRFQPITCHEVPYRDTVYVIRNFGSTPLTLISAECSGNDGADFSLVSPKALGCTISPFDSISVVIRFAPSGDGVRSARLKLRCGNPESDSLSILLFGEHRSPGIEISDAAVDFGFLLPAEVPAERRITVRNRGMQSAVITALRISPADAFAVVSSSSLPLALPPGGTDSVTIRFAPGAKGAYLAEARMEISPCNDTLILALAGEWNDAPRIAAGSALFRAIVCAVDGPRDTTVVLRNVGTAPLEILHASIRGSEAEDFSLLSPLILPPGRWIQPGDSLPFLVRFSPRGSGMRRADLLLRTNAPRDTVHLISLAGMRENLDIDVTPSPIDFGSGCDTGFSRSIPLILRNEGSIDRVVTDLHVEPPGVFRTPAALPFSLPVQGLAAIPILFDPPADGEYASTLHVSFTPCDTTILVPMRGSCGTAPMAITTRPRFPRMLCDDPPFMETTFTLWNTGAKTLLISEATIEGADRSDFSCTPSIPPSRSLAARDSMEFQVRFTPSRTGLHTAALKIVSDAANAPVILLPVEANRERMRLAASVRDIDLGILCANEERDTSFVLRNTGTVSTTALIDCDSLLSVVPRASAILPSDSLSVSVRFTAAAAEGPFAAPLRIRDDCGRIDTVRVHGRIVPPRIALDSLAVPLDGFAAVEGNIVLRNTGARAARITRVSVSDLRFRILSPTPPFLVDSGAGTTIRIRYTPVDTNSVRATLSVQYEPCGSMEKTSVLILPNRIRGIFAGSVDHGILGCEQWVEKSLTIAPSGPDTLILYEARITGADSAEFRLMNPSVPPARAIPPGGSSDLPIRFTPAKPGVKTAALALRCNTWPDAWSKFPLTGQKQDMRISPQDTLLDLGTLCPGEQRTLSMHFRNPGSAAQRLSITASAHFAVSASTIDIESGSTGGFDVRFEALAGQGSIRESILVTDECGIVHQVRCAAKVLAPRLTYTGDGSFHSLPGDTVSRQLLLRNPSSLDIRILTAIVGDARFALAAPTPPFTVASGSGTLLNIRFLSTVPDSVSTELRLDGTPCGAAIAIPVSGTTEEVAATLGCPSISARVDTTVTIPINLLSSANLAARGARTVRIRLAFNRTLLLPVEARATDSLSSGVIVGDSIRGEERIVDIRLMGRKAPSPGTILLLDCLTGLGNAESTPLRISADWMGAYVRTTYSHGEFHSLGLCSQGGLRLLSIPPALILHDVYPNPLTGRTATVSFTVTGDNPEPAPVRISLIGLFGKEVLVTDALFTAGRHLLELNAATVPEGAYVLRMESGGRSAQRRVIILR